METGIVTEMKYHRVRTDVVNTKVFAACNSIKRLPQELRSRFLELYFQPYGHDEFEATVIGILTKREGSTEEVARYIAQCVWKDLEGRDVREAVRLARLCKTKADVDVAVRTLKKYRSIEGTK